MEAEGNKVLGPDGLSFHFAQSFWDIFREDILGLFQVFHSSVEFDHIFLKSFITIIPKNRGPSTTNDF